MNDDEEELLLYDEATRMEAYNEGVKAALVLLFLAYSEELKREIKASLLSAEVDNLNELTKGQLNALIYKLRKAQNKIYASYSERILKELELYSNATSSLTQEVFAIKKELSLEKIWSKLRNAPIPANGIYLEPLFKSFETSSIAEVENAIRKAWANGDSLESTIAKVAGKNSKQGVSTVSQLIEKRSAAIAETAGHFVFSTATSTVLASAFGSYRWVSVMDAVTSDICIERNNKIFVFGLGPLPPAHYRCRSHVVPSVGGKIKPESFSQWIARQPETLRGELLAYSQKKPLSVSDFSKKGAKIKT